MIKACKEAGIILNHKARQFCKADFDKFDLILCADKSNYEDVIHLDPSRKYQGKVQMMCSYVKTYTQFTEVPDPYYEGNFDLVVSMMQDMSQNLLASLSESLHL
mmetsp:Transcript_46235/g.75437  ORF Transcript_46235/g.75437 Transcript_46235/m.75437 type:complete len:104 (-) Transcript_46235:180-491(-)